MEHKQRVLIVHNYYKLPGGEDMVVENEKCLLEEHGHFVDLYSRSNKEIDHFSVIQKLLFPFTILFSLRTYRDVKQLIRENDIDIVHVHNTLSLISPSVYYAAFACKKPVIQTVHNFRLLCPAATFLRDEKICEECINKGLKCAVRYGCYRGSKIQSFMSAAILKLHRSLGTYKRLYYICLTDFNRRKILLLNQREKSYIKEERVFVKSNFTQIPLLKEIQKKEQYLYVGRLEKLKGVRVLLEAWRGLTEKTLLICGSGPEEEWIRSYRKKYSMERVKLLGQCPHEEILRLLKESRALILPTMCYEGQPMTIMESYAVGTPVIASDIGNAGNMIEPEVTGIRFAYGDAEALQKAVMCMEEKRDWDTCSVYEEKYTPEKNYELLQRIYTIVQMEEDGN
ncbi:MAG: glycosyltransferase family 4 protein [Lachnospiraceae bacterium]|jgi:glycosyltransferase involved in cell wall biosynthesis|nr:glycosyltransferase family 4 protein [Lachnospiraceae bacterium]